MTNLPIGAEHQEAGYTERVAGHVTPQTDEGSLELRGLSRVRPLLERIEKGEIDPSFVITHRATLEEGPDLYKTFRDKKEGCIKVVMRPH